MAYLAIRGSGAVNGVSRLHGEVSRRIFANIFPRWPEAEVPVGHVTNGVHMSDMGLAGSRRSLDGRLRQRPVARRGSEDGLKRSFAMRREADLWNMRQQRAKGDGRASAEAAGAPGGRAWRGAGRCGSGRRAFFDPDTLTLGFARRFATYKRPNLLLHDRDRLLRILTNRQRPVQLVLAGKAHPAGYGRSGDDPRMGRVYPPYAGAVAGGVSQRLTIWG